MAEFLEYALHDLLGPLSSVLLWEELLRSSVKDPARRGEALAAIHDSVELMARQVYDMLDITRARAGRLILTDEPIALDVIVDEAIAAARKRGVPIEARVESVRGLHGDAGRIRQAVDRMLSAMAGAAVLPLAVTLTTAPNAVVLDVRRVSTPVAFDTLKPSIETEIADVIVRLHGGRLVSEPWVLRVFLPMAAAAG